MSIPGSTNPLLLFGDPTGGQYQIQRSLRFNSSDSGYLSRNFSVSGNQKIWTWGAWIKRAKLGSEFRFFDARSGGLQQYIRFDSSNALRVLDSNGTLITSQVFRDLSAWYHVLVALDTTQATASNRIKLYVNGSQITTFSTESYPTQNSDLLFNSNVTHQISWSAGTTEYFDGYLADIHFIDGQALTPSSFTEVSATTGQLIPKAYTGTFGTNGFWLKFSDNSAATAATLGNDYSSNNNDWTPNNLSTSTGGPTSVAAASGALPVFNTTDTYGTVKGTGTRTDTNSASIVLALPMDGTNGGTSFGDQSAVIKGSGSAKTVTVNGNSNTSTAQSKFYGSSGLFDGTGDFLGITPTTDFALPGDFTIEAWMYSALSGNNAIFSIGSYTSGLFFRTGEGDLTKITIFINNSQVALSASGAIKASQWTHVAAVRSGSVVTIYVNGVSVVSGTSSYSIPADTTYVGRAVHSTGEDFNGYLQDVRVYKGVAKYTSNFNPPSSTANATVAAGNDSLVDTPTSYGTDTYVGGEVRGNYCTWNPLDKGSNAALTNANLDVASTTQSWSGSGVRGTIGLATGKWYWEITCLTNVSASANIHLGIATVAASLNNYLGADAAGWAYTGFGAKYNNNSGSSYGVSSWVSGAVVGVAFDLDNGTLTFYHNGVSQGQAYSGLTGSTYFPAISVYNASAVFNAGQRPFAYTAPSGFKALVDTNLPAPVVAKSNTVMDVKLYTGNGSTQTISGLNFSPDFVWLKRRDAARNHALYDIVRGVKKYLASDSTSAEYEPASGGVSSFDASSFTVVEQGGVAINESSASMVAWTWDAGTSTVSNTQGSITSQVRANASAGFSVVSYPGTGSTGTLGHGLGVKPQLLIVKSRSQARDWIVYHTSYGATQYTTLNGTGAAAATTSAWNNTEPTSTVFTIGNAAEINTNGSTNIAYCFAPVAGYGNGLSYVGNGSTDGPFCYLGFLPKLILIKCSSTTGNWVLLDTEREGYNVDNDPLFPNLSDAEATTDLLDITSNGFKIRSTNADVNASAATYIVYAWASNPFQYSRAR